MFIVKTLSPLSTPGNTLYDADERPRKTEDEALETAFAVTTSALPADVFHADERICRVWADGGIDWDKPPSVRYI